MKIMAKILEGDKSVIPADKLMIIPTKTIAADNVDAYAASLMKLQNK